MAKSARDRDATSAISRIGPTVRLNGELSGDEDLLIEGSVTGIVAPGNSVTIGPRGQVSGEISGRVITVAGSVDGKLAALDTVTVRGTANLRGQVSGAEILLDDDAQLGDVVLTGKMGRPVRF